MRQRQSREVKSHHRTGVTNVANAIGQAYADWVVPLLVISSVKPAVPGARGWGCLQRTVPAP